MKIAAIGLLFFAIASLANEPEPIVNSNDVSAFQRKIECDHQAALKQEPIGSTTSWSVSTNSDNQIIWHVHNNTSGSNWIVNGGPVPISLPFTFNDTNSGISFRVESDGRHITAIDAGGKTLWHRDPFADAHLEFYRTKAPKIIYIGKANKRSEEYWAKAGKKVIGITFNSSQFGELDIETGDFFFGGQN
jgi:hypothetical protein